MFNVAIDEIFVVLFGCLVVFGSELREVARQAVRLTGQLRLLNQGVLGQPRAGACLTLGWARYTRKPASEPPRREVDAGLAAPVTPLGSRP